MMNEEKKKEIIEKYRDFFETRKGHQVSMEITQMFWKIRKEKRRKNNLKM